MRFTTIGFWIGIVLLVDAAFGILFANAFQRRIKFNLKLLVNIEIAVALILIGLDLLF